MAYAIQYFTGGPRHDAQGRPTRDNWQTLFTRQTQREASSLCAALVIEGFVDGMDIQVVDLGADRPRTPAPAPLPIRNVRTRQQVTELIWLSGERTQPTNHACPYCGQRVTIWDPAVIIAGSSLIHSECVTQLVIDGLWVDAQRRKESSHGCHALQTQPVDA